MNAVVQDHADLMEGVKVLPTVRLSKEQATHFEVHRVYLTAPEVHDVPEQLPEAVNWGICSSVRKLVPSSKPSERRAGP